MEEVQSPPNLVFEGVDTPNEENSESLSLRCGRIVMGPLAHLEDFVALVLFVGDGEPTSYKEAIHCLEKDKWLKAMFEERGSLDKNHT